VSGSTTRDRNGAPIRPLAALDAVRRIPRQQENLAARFGQLTEESDWPASVSRLRPAASQEEVETRLGDLVAAAALLSVPAETAEAAQPAGPGGGT
jgi:hypothetical protein